MPTPSAYDPAVFPFTYEDLDPVLRVGRGDPARCRRRREGTKEEVFFSGAASLGIPHNTNKNISQPSYRAQENAILQPGGTAGLTTVPLGQNVSPVGTGCTFCGYCFQGCKEPFGSPFNQKAKRTTLVSYVPMALTAGLAGSWAPHGKAVTLIPNAFATNITTSTVNGTLPRHCGDVARHDSGATTTEEAQVIVLAGGTTENPRLWLNSGLPNPNDWVGRGYTDHYFDWLVGVFDADTFSSRGVGSSARVDWPGHGGARTGGPPPGHPGLQPDVLQRRHAGLLRQRRQRGRPRGPGTHRPGLGRRPGPADGAGVEKDPRQHRQAGQRARHHGRRRRAAKPGVAVGPEPDDNGPVAKVEFPRGTRSARTIANREFMARRAGELLRGAGATEVVRMDWPPLILHVQSTMRMGTSDTDSVLDENAKSRFVDGLYVADNSALANALGGSNPTVTCQALATRTAEKILVNEFGGAPFVATGSPTVSTDPSITGSLSAVGL